MDIQGRTALITGGARVGSTVARALASQGARIVLLYRSSKTEAEETAEEIRSAGGEAAIIEGDVADPAQISSIVSRAAESFGRLDILVNMASHYEKRGMENLDLQAWEAAINVDARGTYLLSLEAAKFMKRYGAGRIINFSDWLAASGRPRYLSYLPYYTAKMAVLGLTQVLALELAPEILVNAIAPGPILPPAEMSEEERQGVIRSTLLGRWGGPEEIAKAVLFLVESDFITGECLRIDGGRHLK